MLCSFAGRITAFWLTRIVAPAFFKPFGELYTKSDAAVFDETLMLGSSFASLLLSAGLLSNVAIPSDSR